MKFNKKLLTAATAIALVGAAATAQAGTGTATTLNFSDNTAPAPAPLPFSNTSGVYVGGAYVSTGVANTNSFAAGNEFRMIGTDGKTGGGGEKTIVDGGQSWDIAADGTITTTGTDLTPTSGGDGLWQGAIFFNNPFGFQNAPTSLVKDFGAGTISMTWDQGLVAEWGGTFFPMGDTNPANEVFTDGQGSGITLSGTLTGTPANFDFWIWGEHRITPFEDTNGGTGPASGFAGWNAQWELHGTGSQVPVPAAVWLFGSGLMGLVGVARRKKSA